SANVNGLRTAGALTAVLWLTGVCVGRAAGAIEGTTAGAVPDRSALRTARFCSFAWRLSSFASSRLRFACDLKLDIRQHTRYRLEAFDYRFPAAHQATRWHHDSPAKIRRARSAVRQDRPTRDIAASRRQRRGAFLD